MQQTDVYFTVLPGTMLLDLAGVGEPFRIANRFGGKFQLHFVGPRLTPKSFLGLTLHGIEDFPLQLPSRAIVMVPGIAIGQDASATLERREAIAWLRSVVREETILCTVCTGAFLAGSAGLLDGRKCTTHNAYIARLRADFPNAHVIENRIFVKDGNLHSSSGVSAGVDLALRMISDHAGARAALEVAKFLAVYVRRTNADPELSPWLIHRDHINRRVHEVQDMIIRSPEIEWTIPELARKIHTCPRNLTRLFAAHVGLPPLTYIRKIRTAVAKDLMAASDLSLERIAEMVGFKSSEQLRRAWLKFEQTSPSKMRKSGGRAEPSPSSSYGE